MIHLALGGGGLNLVLSALWIPDPGPSSRYLLTVIVKPSTGPSMGPSNNKISYWHWQGSVLIIHGYNTLPNVPVLSPHGHDMNNAKVKLCGKTRDRRAVWQCRMFRYELYQLGFDRSILIHRQVDRRDWTWLGPAQEIEWEVHSSNITYPHLQQLFLSFREGWL